uniref:Ankyrin repeat and zinc finger domain containing protein n=1 Tax=Echinococcus granulosus TaxID=6210 RepID=A0A068X2E1_ECHGR|nr:ankyrin repeat and zinc finger domain containing protein [Echinococcus granulosus]
MDRLNCRTCDRISYFNRKCSVDALTGLVLLIESLPNAPVLANSVVESPTAPYTASMRKFDCITCRVSCIDAAEMKAHFKSKLHIATISKGIPRCTANENWLPTWSESESDGSSTSTSLENENEENEGTQYSVLGSTPIQRPNFPGKPMMFFRNRKDEIVGIYRCLLYTKEAPPRTFEDLLDRVNLLRKSRFWAILLYSGGKFAGGIFDEDKEVVHKTLHRYTVRAKQGGGQSLRDATMGGLSGHKSAGSNLRRHGEMAIRADISHLLHVKWRSYLQACQFILTWTPKVHRAIFYTPPSSSTPSTTELQEIEETNDAKEREKAEGDGSGHVDLAADPLAAEAVASRMGVVVGDPRLRRLPCRAKNITYTHVKELQSDLSRFRVFEHYADLDLISLSERRQIEQGEETIFESRSGRLFRGCLADLPIKSSSQDSPPPPLSSPTITSPSSLEPATKAAAVPPSKQRARRKRRKDNRQKEQDRVSPLSPSSSPSPNKSLSSSGAEDAVKRADEWLATKSAPVRQSLSTSDLAALCNTYSDWHRSLQLATAVGDVERLTELLLSPPASGSVRGSSPSKAEVSSSGMEPWPEDEATVQHLLNYRFPDGRSLLHLAVELQGDPEVVRILLMAGCRPEGRDNNGMTPYFLAKQIGKKKLLTCFKSFRQDHPDRYDYEKAGIPLNVAESTSANAPRQQRKNNQIASATGGDAARKLDRISMREKCASAAEKRALLAQQRGKPQVTCDQCSMDMTGKQPFSYLTFVFCSSECLRNHRLKNLSLRGDRVNIKEKTDGQAARAETSARGELKFMAVTCQLTYTRSPHESTPFKHARSPGPLPSGSHIASADRLHSLILLESDQLTCPLEGQNVHREYRPWLQKFIKSFFSNTHTHKTTHGSKNEE